MAEKITFFEFHFDGPLRIGPSFGDDPSPETEATDGGESQSAVSEAASSAVTVDPEDDESADDDSGRPVKGAIVGFLLIVALAVAARVLLGGDEDEVDDVEIVELDDVDEEIDDAAT